ncbi:GNAT family N-acetyltransferase [Bacillus sp. SL00103]
MNPSRTQKGEIQWYDNIFKEQTGIRWGISLKDDPAIIGSCGFLNLEKQHCRTEIGYELHHDHWRKRHYEGSDSLQC